MKRILLMQLLIVGYAYRLLDRDLEREFFLGERLRERLLDRLRERLFDLDRRERDLKTKIYDTQESHISIILVQLKFFRSSTFTEKCNETLK